MLKKEYLIYKLSEAAKEACKIDNELFPMYNAVSYTHLTLPTNLFV